jgi:hypothetical protein
MNQMTPKPQGVIIWDVEGQEFVQSLSYIGNPSMLATISPEMDPIADDVFAKLRNAGYLVGVTLRPQTFHAGLSLPATCQTGVQSTQQDVFVNTAASYPYRGYACTAVNTWTQPGGSLPGFQTVLNDDAQVLQQLYQKVAYAHSRWGARLFYVDTNIYLNGSPIDHEIFRTLAKEFPDCLFMPELKSPYYPGSTAPYNEPSQGLASTPSVWKQIYPTAFSLINTAHANLVTQYSDLLGGVKAGDILLFQAFWDAPEIPVVQQLYADAAK